jgi:FKBP-type peptidyl-prolyl cis-trans isomerase FkpA
MNSPNFYRLLSVFTLCALVSCSDNGNSKSSQKSASEEQLIEVNRILVKKDSQKIRNFIRRKGWDMTESDLGYWYEILEPGHGELASDGEIARFKYSISLLDGTICYTSDKDGLKSFLIGKGNVEAGLEDGILYLREGSRARFIFPPYLAHGLPGDGKRIPARAIIIYEIEIISLTNPE